MSDIVIVDYGMANLRSVQKAFEQVGHAATITVATRTASREAAKVVLPGVGAFRDAIARLRETHLDAAIADHIDAGRPFLGICLGLQMLFARDHEDGVHEGLGPRSPATWCGSPRVPGLKVPHMGWNTLDAHAAELPAVRRTCRPTRRCTSSTRTTRCPADRGVRRGDADYPQPFAAAIWRDNVFATQFHPEKSQRVGLQMLRNFAGM